MCAEDELRTASVRGSVAAVRGPANSSSVCVSVQFILEDGFIELIPDKFECGGSVVMATTPPATRDTPTTLDATTDC